MHVSAFITSQALDRTFTITLLSICITGRIPTFGSTHITITNFKGLELILESDEKEKKRRQRKQGFQVHFGLSIKNVFWL